MTSPSAPSCWSIRLRTVSGWSSARWYSSEPSRSQTPGRAGRAEDLVVRVPGSPADPPSRHAPDQLILRDVDEDGGGDTLAALVERHVQRRRLDGRPREAVEDDPGGRVGPAQPLQEQPDRDLVGDELARRPCSASPPRPAACRRGRRPGRGPRWRPPGSRVAPRATGPGCPCRPPGPRAGRRRSLDEALVLPDQQLGLELLHRLDDDGDHDQDAGATQREAVQRR